MQGILIVLFIIIISRLLPFMLSNTLTMLVSLAVVVYFLKRKKNKRNIPYEDRKHFAKNKKEKKVKKNKAEIYTEYTEVKDKAKKTNFEKAEFAKYEEVNPSAATKGEKIKEELFRITILARNENLPFLNTIELLIDELKALIPKLYEKYPDKELTWQTEKIATVYFPELLDAYITLNADQRFIHKEELKNSLEMLEGEIMSIRAAFQSAKETDFDIKTNEIRSRFSKIIKK